MLTGVVKHEGTFALVDIFAILAHQKLLANKQFMQYDLLEEVPRILASTETSNTLAPLIARSMFNIDDLKSGDLRRLIPGLIDVGIRRLICLDTKLTNLHYSTVERSS